MVPDNKLKSSYVNTFLDMGQVSSIHVHKDLRLIIFL
ncbi:hypothetical protein TSAR_013739 [Trichomalopsis sarcophagae]|uniref:Uncharacterized protein n=1 Tax=Trichomalopsis sarcophagae TaxID=543379 RepID=A0A232EGY4_9HYME|nr:hypothetical protein TSAR_013739 [Trichomalopsis sarcophagae]